MKPPSYLLAAGASALLVAAIASAGNTDHHEQAHTLRIVDGDTLVYDGEKIRLYGIDAPELKQVCSSYQAGADAKALLEVLASGAAQAGASERTSTIHVDRRGFDRYGRTLAIVSSDGMDLNAMMVKTGHAWAYLKYSYLYDKEQAVAKATRVGIWGHDCIPAWEWRHEHR